MEAALIHTNMLNLQFTQGGEVAAAEGLYIPDTNLPGLDSAEMAPGTDYGLLESKAILALLTAISGAMPTSVLGLSIAQGSPSGAGANVLNNPFTLTWQQVANLAAGTLQAPPLPTTGANASVGGVGTATVFPLAQVVAAGGALDFAGVAMPLATLQAYAPLVISDLTPAADNRKFFAALFDAIGGTAQVRAADTASGTVSRTQGSISTAALPAAWTAATDPLTDLAEADRPVLGVFTRSNTVSIQVQLDQSTQQFEVLSTTT